MTPVRAFDLGPSPRGRGSPGPSGHPPHRPGSIPAWAGEPDAPECPAPHPRVHPRVGGGARDQLWAEAVARGPSPRGRGSRRPLGHEAAGRGSIPAWAGEPGRRPAARRPRRVHPRVGGGAPMCAAADGTQEGPSPRGRGSRRPLGHEAAGRGSIPAWAGEPRSRRAGTRPRSVHPRVGGGARSAFSARASWEGPSPRGRGSL